MLKRLKQLDAGALLGGQLPRTMDFEALLCDSFANPGTSMAALTDAQPAGLIRHVATRVDEEDDLMKWIDFVVECADGTVNVCISVEMKHYEYIQAEYISKIMVKIVEAH
jgi:hypothetical protein